MIGPERKRGSVTSTAATREPCIWPRCLGAGPAIAECSAGCAHTRDTPALCGLSASPELWTVEAELELYGGAAR